MSALKASIVILTFNAGPGFEQSLGRLVADLKWRKTIVEAGYKLVYEPRSAVLHSHERGAFYDLRRHYADGLLLQDLFGLGPTLTLGRIDIWIKAIV